MEKHPFWKGVSEVFTTIHSQGTLSITCIQVYVFCSEYKFILRVRHPRNLCWKTSVFRISITHVPYFTVTIWLFTILFWKWLKREKENMLTLLFDIFNDHYVLSFSWDEKHEDISVFREKWDVNPNRLHIYNIPYPEIPIWLIRISQTSM